jgi:DNA (cytosine-5)-methyltransferase 1
VRYNTFIDLFAGCGGFSLGLCNAGWKGIFAIEKNVDAFSTLKHNLLGKGSEFRWPRWLPKENIDINQLLKLYGKELKKLSGKVDLIAGGPPCQGFSTAGRRKENDVRNGLIKSYLKFVKIVQPKLILFENVRGFTQKFEKNKTKGRVYSDYVKRSLERLGYEIEGRLVDFSKFGVPQKRTRFILVAVRKDVQAMTGMKPKSFFKYLIGNKTVFLKNKHLPQTPSLGSAISDLLKSNGTRKTPDRSNFETGKYNIKPKSKYQRYLRREYRRVLPDSHSFPKHSSKVSERFALILRTEKTDRYLNKAARESLNLNKHTIFPLSSKGIAPTLTSLPDDLIHYLEPRILTVREYARIQTFPDWYEFKGKYTTGSMLRKIEVPRYTQIGNAVPPLFGEQSGLALRKLLNG